MVIELKYQSSLNIDTRELNSVRQSLEISKNVLETAWYPDRDVILKDLNKLISEIDRVKGIPVDEYHYVSVFPGHILEVNANNKIVASVYRCTCSMGQDHFYNEMDVEEMNCIVTDLVTKKPVEVKLPHFVYQFEDPLFKYSCTCYRTDDHTFDLMTEADVAEHVAEWSSPLGKTSDSAQ